MANWYYAIDGQTLGPVDAGQIAALARQGTLNPASYVVAEGESTWQSLSDVEAIFGLAASPFGTYTEPAPMPAAAPPAAPVEATPGWSDPSGWAAPGQSAAPTQPGFGGMPSEPVPPTGAPYGQPQGYGQPPGYPQPGGYPAPGQYQAPVGYPHPPTYGDPANAGQWGAPAGYPAQPYPGAQWAPYGAPGGAASKEGLAGWGSRFLAKLIDLLIVAIPGGLVFWAVAYKDLQDRIDAGDNGFTVTYGGRTLGGSVLYALIGYAYFAILNGRGQTFGKMALGIKVVGADSGAPIGMGKGFVRHVVGFIASFLSCFGFIWMVLNALWPLWDNRQQALHDKIAGSLVVKAK